MNVKNILLGPVFLLLLSGYAPCVHAMLSKSERPLVQESAKQQVLNRTFFATCRSGDVKLMRNSLAQGADKNGRCHDLGYTGRHYAAKYGNLDVLKVLLKTDHYPEDDCLDDLTPLYLATQFDQVEVVKWYLEEKNADIHIEYEEGSTLPIVASAYGAKNVLQLLIKKGADVRVQNSKGKDAFALACKDGYLDCARILVPYVNVNRRLDSATNITALYVAAGMGNFDIVKFLMENGADPELCTTEGFKPIDAAKCFKNEAIIEYLDKWSVFEKSGKELIVSEDSGKAKKRVQKTNLRLNNVKPIVAVDSKNLLQSKGSVVVQNGITEQENKKIKTLVAVQNSNSNHSKKVTEEKSVNKFVHVIDNKVGYKKSSIFLFPDNKNQLNHYADSGELENLVAIPQQLDTVGTQLSKNHLLQAGYSAHVKEKMELPNDIFHNFTPNIEKKYGHLAETRVIDFHLHPQKKQYWEKQLGSTTSIANRWFELHCQIPAQVRSDVYPSEKAQKQGPTGIIKYIVLAEGLADDHEKTIVHRCFELTDK